jgi:hypothetical protein
MALKPILSCRPVHPEDLPPERLALWEKTLEVLTAEGEPLPKIYPGSVFVPCEKCKIQVAVGPRQQQILDVVQVLCFLCTMEETQHTKVSVTDLPAFSGEPEENPELVDHILGKQLRPLLLADQLRQQGRNTSVGRVSTRPDAQGYLVRCSRCDRTSTMETQPPEDAVVTCPNCI